jgi:hypothetical protein
VSVTESYDETQRNPTVLPRYRGEALRLSLSKREETVGGLVIQLGRFGPIDRVPRSRESFQSGGVRSDRLIIPHAARPRREPYGVKDVQRALQTCCLNVQNRPLFHE